MSWIDARGSIALVPESVSDSETPKNNLMTDLAIEAMTEAVFERMTVNALLLLNVDATLKDEALAAEVVVQTMPTLEINATENVTADGTEIAMYATTEDDLEVEVEVDWIAAMIDVDPVPGNVLHATDVTTITTVTLATDDVHFPVSAIVARGMKRRPDSVPHNSVQRTYVELIKQPQQK